MKNSILVLMLMLSGVGCRGVNRLIDGPDGTPPPAPKIIVGGQLAPMSDSAPEFNVPVPAGYTKTVYYGVLPIDGKVQVAGNATSRVDVFMLERSINQWFKLKPEYSDAFYYSFDATTGIVQYKGLHLDGKGFCVYQYMVTQP